MFLLTLCSAYGEVISVDDTNVIKSKRNFSNTRTGDYSSMMKSCEYLKQISGKAFKQCVSQEESIFSQRLEENYMPK
jgi:hypothetical protein